VLSGHFALPLFFVAAQEDAQRVFPARYERLALADAPRLGPFFLFVGIVGHFFAAFFGVDSEIRVGVGDDKAINTAKLLGGGSVAPQPASNRPKTHAAHLFGLPDLSSSSVIASALFFGSSHVER
jgi:hypothetical protein